MSTPILSMQVPQRLQLNTKSLPPDSPPSNSTNYEYPNGPTQLHPKYVQVSSKQEYPSCLY